MRARPSHKRSRPFALLALLLGLSLLAVSSLVSPAEAEGRRTLRKKETQAATDDEIDHLSLAARLLKDAHYERAEATLGEVNEKREGLDLPRFYTLLGLVYLKTERHAKARDSFQKAIRSGQTEPSIYMYLAQAYFGLKAYADTLRALDEAGPAASDSPSVFLVRAQCHWELKQPQRAIDALLQGQENFPHDTELRRRHFYYLVDLGLYQEALAFGQELLRREGAGEEDYIAVGEALRQARQYDKAEHILEAARLRFPQSERLTLLLAHTYLAHDNVLTAAMLFEEAALSTPEHALEAAELYKRGKRFERALALNARVLDQKAKLKQRMSILLQLERFEMVAAMAPHASRLGLLEQDDIRYALAYAYFKIGDFSAAEKELKYIQSAEVFNSANELRKLMQTCREAGWECL
jgi:tetratricopeptide (TPR) repeat protein